MRAPKLTPPLLAHDTPITCTSYFLRVGGCLTYWGAWQNVAVRFAKKDEKSVPAHWRTSGSAAHR